jgi:hypothetical protein
LEDAEAPEVWLVPDPLLLERTLEAVVVPAVLLASS